MMAANTPPASYMRYGGAGDIIMEAESSGSRDEVLNSDLFL